jgi:serine phosphatase RsbU (regulator of sigma subunit)
VDGGFVTACCLFLARDGSPAIIANAGHLAPYVDSHEAALESGLPLGVVAGVTYAEARVPGDRFTLISDGVVEASNAQNELIGFDRTRAMAANSAQEIARAAQAWGQNDDITVVTVRRIG